MKVSINPKSKLIIEAQKATGIIDLKELIEKAFQLLIDLETKSNSK